MVSFNQLNIVIGISAAFFSNYLILRLGMSDLGWAQALNLAEWNWRWMLGVEAIPAIIYFLALFEVPESPRWLVMHDRDDEALEIMERVSDTDQARAGLQAVHDALDAEKRKERAAFGELFQPAMRLVLAIGLSIAILQQITGINSVFFYAPMIFEQSGIGTDASFLQAILVGLVNLVFTLACDPDDRPAWQAAAARIRSGRHRRVHAGAFVRIRFRELYAGRAGRGVAPRDR